MLKPNPPRLADFGISEADIQSVPDFANSRKAFGRITLALIVLYEFYKAVTISPDDWANNWLAYIIFGLFLAFVASIPAAIVALLICEGADQVLMFFVPRFALIRRSASAFQQAKTKYQAELQRYELWVRRQKESYWKSLDGIAFELELGGLFKRMGYQVATTRHTGDGGVDLILEKAGEKTVVQCKAHASKVGIGTARELVASMIDFRADRGILAATSGVTKPVYEYVRDKKIQILDLNGIMDMQHAHGEREQT